MSRRNQAARLATSKGMEMAMGVAQQTSTPARRRSRHSAAVCKAAEYIERNSTEPIMLHELAALANLSPCRFATIFRREIGLPPHRYLCHIRVQNAMILLRSGVPLAMVASEAGFFDQSHLSRHFKSICGVTPGKYLSHVRPLSDETRALHPVGQRHGTPAMLPPN
jgi:transcriptional regulator GlxA family with amidase domain